jgi:hypothetical protein
MESSWHTTAIKLLHTGQLDKAEAHLKKRPDNAHEGYSDIILLETLIAKGKLKESKELYERLLWAPWLDTSPQFKDKLQRYTKYFLRIWTPRAYDLHPMEAIPEGTTLVGGSICAHSGGLGVIARALNTVYDGKELKQSGDRWKRYINTLYWCVLDPSLRMLSSARLVDKAIFPRANDAFVGYEDPRVFTWQGDVWMTSTSYQIYRSGKAHVVLSRIEGDRVASVIPLQCPDMNDDQRHWCPWIHKNTLHLLYRAQPWTVLRVDNTDTGATTVVTQRSIPLWNDTIFPATSPVPYKKGYITIIAYHDPPKNHEERTLYRYVRLNADLVPTHYSSSWVLWEPELETIQGMVIHGEYVYLTYGYRQKECRVTRFILPLLETAVVWYPLPKDEKTK